MNMAESPFKQLDVIRELSVNEKKVKDCYRLMYKKELWIKAYVKLSPKAGNLTKGISEDTIDGFNVKIVDDIIKQLKEGEYRFSPIRRAYIPKKNGGKRRLGIAGFRDKLVQEVMRMILENIYEPVFTNNSHGFRKNKSCHTALQDIKNTWRGMSWCIEGDIKDFFNNINHKILLRLISKKIDDRRFILLLKNALECGYVEEWKFNKTFSGCPQGGVISPILSNIYLHELDKFMEAEIKTFNKGNRRKSNPEYIKIGCIIKKLKSELQEKDELYGKNWNGRNELIRNIKQMKCKALKIHSVDYMDNNFRRLRYVRYVDDFVIGIKGSKEDALEIKKHISKYLFNELKLELSEEKTLITNLKDRILFLGYEFRHWNRTKILKVKRKDYKHPFNKRTLSKVIKLEVPNSKMYSFTSKNEYGNLDTLKSIHKNHLLNNSELEIISTYNSELRGFGNYYKLADNFCYAYKLFYLAESSFIKTLARKRKSTYAKVMSSLISKEQNELNIEFKDKNGKTKMRRFLRAKHIVRSKDVITNSDPSIDLIPNTIKYNTETELEKRLLANKCEACGTEEGIMEVHHIKKLKNIRNNKNLTRFEKIMIARNRKTLVLCYECHKKHHLQKLPINQLASRMR
jgi:group II intron reverse transcriptase/maturase